MWKGRKDGRKKGKERRQGERDRVREENKNCKRRVHIVIIRRLNINLNKKLRRFLRKSVQSIGEFSKYK